MPAPPRASTHKVAPSLLLTIVDTQAIRNIFPPLPVFFCWCEGRGGAGDWGDEVGLGSNSRCLKMAPWFILGGQTGSQFGLYGWHFIFSICAARLFLGTSLLSRFRFGPDGHPQSRQHHFPLSVASPPPPPKLLLGSKKKVFMIHIWSLCYLYTSTRPLDFFGLNIAMVSNPPPNYPSSGGF